MIKGLRALVLAAVVFCFPVIASGAIFTEGVQTNPSSNTILADTQALADGGLKNIKILLASTVDARMALQIRNATNTGNIHQFLFTCGAFQTTLLDFGRINIQPNQRFRIIVNPGITGNVQATIILR